MKRTSDNDQNFWISYADLMAGLLFVFILLIGAIVIKYVYTQNNLENKNELLLQKDKAVLEVKNKLLSVEDTLKAVRILLSEEEQKNYNANEIISLKNDELNSIKNSLLQTQNELKSEKNVSSNLSSELNTSLQTIQKANDEIKITKEELLTITQKLFTSTLAHQKLVEDLNLTKARIQNLTGIRIKAIQALKSKLGDNIEVDSKNGSIKLSSSVLFDVGSFTLKKDAKDILSSTLKKYINTLLNDKMLSQYIDSIVIEGYTDSDGGYLYNLQLSQKRAFSVLQFLYLQDDIDKKILKKFVSASGKSYNNLVYKNNKEDKNASRRIEVKFSISNKKALQEIESFLKSEHK